MLLERHRLTSGTTWHAAGLIMQLRSSHAFTELAKYNVELYSRLESETGQETGFKQNGTLGICRTKERLHETKRTASIAKSFGIEACMISPVEARDLYPPLKIDAIEGAIYIPQDGQTNPVDTTMSLIAGARQLGAGIFERCEAKTLRRLSTQQYLVETVHGSIQCETLILACGLWTRQLALQLGIRVPLYPCEHFYVLTQPLAAVTADLPVLRDTDGHNYVKEDAGRWLVGAFEPKGKPVDFKDIPSDAGFVEFPEDWEQFELPFRRSMEVLPDLCDAGITKFFSGPESFTPDLLFALGEVPGLPNCFVSAGYNSEGIELNPGAGRALAEWIANGKPTMDLSAVNVARFHQFQNNLSYLRRTSSEVLGLHYRMHWPHRQKTAARNVRKSVLHDRWVDLNASFGEALGWERPMWFAPKGTSAENVYSYTQPNWFQHTAMECEAARQNAVIIDQSSFGKHLVQGRDSRHFLQILCSSDVDVPVGKIVYTHMLNDDGGIEVDATVNRLDEDRYLIVTSATTHPRDKAWIQKHVAQDWHVMVTDVTSCYAVLSIQGPNSRKLLSRITSANLSDENFPYANSKRIELGYGYAICNRLTFIGELGWEIFIDAEFAQDFLDSVLEAGSHLRLKPAGYHALEHLRCEAGYREYDFDLTPLDTPYEAGLGFTVDLSKSVDFNGRSALESQLTRHRLCKRLVMFKLHDRRVVLFGEEPIWLDGQNVGYLSSGAFSFTLGRSVGMGYVSHAEGITNQIVLQKEWEIEVACVRHCAEASLKPFLCRNL